MLPSSNLSKNQIDRLGDRLRKGRLDDDLRLLDSYRRSFSHSYEEVILRIREELGLESTGRPQKTNASIIEKLRRQNTRLSQMQDIAGCRIVAPDMLTQDELVERLKTLFPEVDVDDRREQPSHGYRAVHVIVENSGKLVEVQVRTQLQHLWAEVSEKLSGVVDANIKYGKGDKDILVILDTMSQKIREQEFAEAAHLRIMAADDTDEDEEFLEGPKFPEIMLGRLSIARMLHAISEVIPRLKREQ